MSAGPYLVDPAPGVAALIAAAARDESGVDRSATSAPSANSTTEMQSAGVVLESACTAACCARCHVSP